MIVTYDGEGNITASAENDQERLGMEYEFKRRGTAALKEKLTKHYIQRFNQMNYENTRSLDRSLKELPEADRNEITQIIAAEIAKRKP